MTCNGSQDAKGTVVTKWAVMTKPAQLQFPSLVGAHGPLPPSVNPTNSEERKDENPFYAWNYKVKEEKTYASIPLAEFPRLALDKCDVSQIVFGCTDSVGVSLGAHTELCVLGWRMHGIKVTLCASPAIHIVYDRLRRSYGIQWAEKNKERAPRGRQSTMGTSEDHTSTHGGHQRHTTQEQNHSAWTPVQMSMPAALIT